MLEDQTVDFIEIFKYIASVFDVVKDLLSLGTRKCKCSFNFSFVLLLDMKLGNLRIHNL